jgi:hypothetical protein
VAPLDNNENNNNRDLEMFSRPDQKLLNETKLLLLSPMNESENKTGGNAFAGNIGNKESEVRPHHYQLPPQQQQSNYNPQPQQVYYNQQQQQQLTRSASNEKPLLFVSSVSKTNQELLF